MSASDRAAWLARGGARKKSRAVAPPALSAGVWFAVAEGSAARPDYVAAYVDAFLSPAWPAPLRYLTSQSVGGRAHPRPTGAVRASERAPLLRELLAHPDLWEVTLATSERNTGDYARLAVETRPPTGHSQVTFHGRRGVTADNTPAVDAWIGEMLALAERVGAHHGTVAVMADDAVASEASFVAHLREGVHPHPDQFERMRASAAELGRRYVRFPRWGTLLSRAHVEALGGVARLTAAVKPAVVREWRDALYLQLTTSVADATGAEAERRLQAFTAAAAPLLPA